MIILYPKELLYEENKSTIKIKREFDTPQKYFLFTLLLNRGNHKLSKPLPSSKAPPFDNIPGKLIKNSKVFQTISGFHKNHSTPKTHY